MTKMRAKQKMVIAAVSFAVCSVIFLAVLVYPLFRGVLDDNKKVLAHKQEILQLKEEARSSREFEMFSDQYVKELAQLEELFVDSKIPVAFFRFLDGTAALLHMQVEKSPGALQQLEGDRWPSFQVRLTGRGSYPDAMAFLQKIENAAYLLEVQTFKITKISREVELSMSIKVFTQPL